MSRYEEYFDTDWDSLDRDEAMMRAFALGVDAYLGESNAEEFEAIKTEMTTTYDESIVELAYKEGQNKAQIHARKTDADDLQIWKHLLATELDADMFDLDAAIDIDLDDVLDDADRPTDLPSAIADITSAIDFPELDPDQTDFPEFLE